MLSTAEISKVLTGGLKHPNYDETVELAEKLRIHANGEYPKDIIDERRPHEDPEIKAYREKIYQPITKKTVTKVITSLGKIRRSSDWIIKYKPELVPSSVTDSETLEKYSEYKYPSYGSVTNWIFSELLKRYLIDANAINASIPLYLPTNKSEYIKPVGKIFDSSQVWWFRPEIDAVLLSSEKVYYGETNIEGQVFYYIDTENIVRYEQGEGGYSIAWEFKHNFGRLPAFKVGGQYLKEANNDVIYESRIASMVPSLDEAAREYSDLQAEIVQHIHSEKYGYTNAECPECMGKGSVMKNEEWHQCSKCNGVGSIRDVSPYGMTLINAAKVGEMQLPNPPFGYIQKQTEIAMLQDTRVKSHLRDALSAINMEFLAETPLDQSGIAKEVDRDELNTFVNLIAEDLVAIMDKNYYFNNEYRYSLVVPLREKRELMLPQIPVPEKYDLLSASMIISDLEVARRANVNPLLIQEIEIEYARKKFNVNPERAYMLQAVYTLDPLSAITEDEKMTRLSNGGITELAYIISSNIVSFVQRAVFEKGVDFFGVKLNEQKALMEQYANEIKAQNDAATPIVDSLVKEEIIVE